MFTQPHMEVHPIVAELSHFHGYRSLWFDGQGQLFHAEPEEEWETHGCTFVACVMRPNSHQLQQVLSQFFYPEEPFQRAAS